MQHLVLLSAINSIVSGFTAEWLAWSHCRSQVNRRERKHMTSAGIDEACTEALLCQQDFTSCYGLCLRVVLTKGALSHTPLILS